jgi:hypothetical protein
MAATVNLTLDQGGTFSRNVTWKAGTPKVPVNLNGYSATLHVRGSASSSAIRLSLTTANGGIVITPLSGTFTLKASPTQTKALPAGRYVYELKAVSFEGQVTALMKGALTVNAEVAKL